MAAPKRPKKATPKTPKTDNTPKSLAEKRAESETTPQEETPVEVETAEAEAVDKDALIASLQADIATQEEQASKIAELQEQLAAAEKQAGDSAAIGTNEFKTRPDKDDKEKFFFFEITWHPKRSDSDEEFVTLGVNGKIMLWPRNKATVIRSDYLEVADNAFVPKFKQLPGEDRKEIGGLKPFTYTINRKINEEEYLRRKKEGDLALRDDLSNKGMSL